jgi:U4/U6 small nuclear ribonucleoprotein PRP31
MRRLKERYEETALMKQVNTRAFSTQVGEYGDDAMGITLGLLDTKDGTAGSGSVRKTTGERKKMKYANTRESRKRNAIQQQQVTNNATNNPLHDSSMIFNPNHGMELINPDTKKQKPNESNQKWFSDTARFNTSNK